MRREADVKAGNEPAEAGGSNRGSPLDGLCNVDRRHQ